jgi:hypothetical protein
MCRSKSILVSVGLVAASVLFLGAPAANADMITLLDPSFELPNVGSGGYQAGTVPTNWTLDKTSDPGIYLAWEYAPLEAPDGNQWAELHTGCCLWQNTGVQMHAGYTYTLGAYGTHDRTGGTSQLELMASAADNSSSRGSLWVDQKLAMTDVFASYSTSIVATSDQEGKYLTVAVGGCNAQWTLIDAVSASYTVPEPSTIMLLSTAAIGLLCYAWRKRK